jgi:hypothetical protein
MSERPTQCSAVLSYRTYHPCANGFPMTGACITGNGTPVCMNEKICARLYDRWGGKPPAHMVELGRSALEGEK